MSKIINTLALSVILSISATAHAEFSDLDWKVEGDNKAFLQEETGLEWLRFAPTLGMSINEVKAETTYGGMFEGFRVAQRAEVNSLMEELYPTWDVDADPDGRLDFTTAYSGGNFWPYANVRTPFVNLFGRTYKYDLWYDNIADYRSYGWYENDFQGRAQASDVLLSGVRFYRRQIGPNSRYHTYRSTIYQDHEGSSVYTTDTKSTLLSVFLVSDGGFTLSNISSSSTPSSDVSAPLMLMGSLSLFGLSLIRRRKA